MIEQYLKEWQERGIGVLLIGGQVMLAEGLRERTKDIDVCLTERQCPKMLEWLIEKNRQGLDARIRVGSAPLHADWLRKGWTCHVEIQSTDRIDLFGIPVCAPNRLVERFYENPSQSARASLVDMGFLKRTERPQDWADIDLIIGRLREQGALEAMLVHLFGNALVDEFVARRDDLQFRERVQRSQEAAERSILRLGLSASIEDFRAMARAERLFWEILDGLGGNEWRDKTRGFWRQHGTAIRGATDFATQHATLLTAARADLPCDLIENPAALIDRAREESGAHRWPGLLPSTDILIEQYFSERRSHLGTQVKDTTGLPRPAAREMSQEERSLFQRSLDEVLLEHWGIDRFEIYGRRFTPPRWLEHIPALPLLDTDGRLPSLNAS